MSAEDRKVVVDACRREDVAEVRRILEAAPEAAMWSEEALEAALRDAPEQFLVAWNGSAIAGFILGRVVGAEAEILDLAVKQEFRRSGVGTALLETLLTWYDGAGGVEKSFLEVRESNRGAIAFYRGMGFREVGRREGYYRDPAEAALVLARKSAVGNVNV